MSEAKQCSHGSKVYDARFEAKSHDYRARVTKAYGSSSEVCASLTAEEQQDSVSCELSSEGAALLGPVDATLEMQSGISYWETKHGQEMQLAQLVFDMATVSQLGKSLFNDATPFSDCSRL
jgi:hypothetical protein